MDRTYTLRVILINWLNNKSIHFKTSISSMFHFWVESWKTFFLSYIYVNSVYVVVFCLFLQ